MRRLTRRRKVALGVGAAVVLIGFFYVGVAIKAYADTPAVMARATALERMPLRLEDFPPDRLRALLAVEDPQFYSHRGIDLATPGAGITTITQGLVKLYYFKQFRPGIAKLRQSVIALVMNRRLSKETQLRLFINSVYMGNYQGEQIYGFQRAARAYFDKEFAGLTKDEYLSLVAMIVGPNGYNVLKQPAENAERVRRIKRLLKGECQPQGNGDVMYEGCR